MVDIAYAIKDSEQQSTISNQQNSQKSSGSNQKSKPQKSEEKVQKTIEDITQMAYTDCSPNFPTVHGKTIRYSTALALRALANVKPNLSISSNDITFLNPTPTAGETITITANVKNSGPGVADNVTVQFYDEVH